MRGFSLATAATAFATLFAAARADVDPIVIKGSKFFYKTNGTQFYIKGVAYQQNAIQSGGNPNNFVDPLADPAGCKRDIPYLLELQTNTVRVYAVDPSADHSECMSMLADAGIYTLIDLGTPNTSITSNQPSWTLGLFDHYKSVVDTFQQYNNVLGFFAANEVVFQPNVSDAAPFVKAATRDTKAYIKSKGYREIGVGYATDDNAGIRGPLSDYLNCGDQENAIDFWGYNVYSWCGDSTFEASGYKARTEEFANYSIPAFFAEYGCNKTQPRQFTDTPVIYSSEMDGVWSGAIVYVYFQDPNNYGLVSVGSDGNVTPLPDFTSLSSQIATVSPTIVTASNYSPTNSPRACPSSNSDFAAAASPLPPTPNKDVCSCMYDSISCKPAKAANSSDYGPLFSYICGHDNSACDAIDADGTTGTYGKYSYCYPVEQLGWVMNQYYMDHGSNSDDCNFSGSAVLVSATAASTCGTVLSQASGVTGSASGGASSSSPHSGASSMNRVYSGEFGSLVSMVLLVPVAFISGIGMILL